MTTKTKNPFHPQLHVAMIALACIAWCWASAAAAQSPKKAARPAPSPQAAESPAPAAAKEAQPAAVTQLFYLKHAKASEMAQMLDSVFGGGTLKPNAALHVVPDSRLNAVLVVGTPADISFVEALLKKFDQPAAPRPGEPEARVRIYQIKHADPSMVLAVLTTMFTGRPSVRLSLDPKNNAVVMMASPEELKTAAELVQTLDVPKTGPKGAAPGAACQIRIVWLASGLSSKETPAPTDDLKQVVDQLASLGVKDVRQVGQIVVNTLVEGKFEVRCSPLFEGAPAELSVGGQLYAKTEPVQLTLRIAAKQRRPITVGLAASKDAAGGAADGAVELVNMDTVISPRLDGSYVVLGVAPVGKVTSVFVVQATQRPER